MPREDKFFWMGMLAAVLCAFSPMVVDGIFLSGALAAVVTTLTHMCAHRFFGALHAKPQRSSH